MVRFASDQLIGGLRLVTDMSRQLDLVDLVSAHGGVSRWSDTVVVKSGSRAPHAGTLSSVGNAASRPVPHPQAVRVGPTPPNGKALAAQQSDEAVALEALDAVPDGPCEVRMQHVEDAMEGTCFPAGTLVMTPTGEVAIEALRPGDEVLSRPDTAVDAAVVSARVEELFERSDVTVAIDLVAPDLTSHRLVCTADHRLYTSSGAWVRADELQPGVRLHGGQAAWLVRAVEADAADPVPVYTLHVRDLHTFFVRTQSTDGPGSWVWVHNECAAKSLARDAVRREILTSVPPLTPSQVIARMADVARVIRKHGGAVFNRMPGPIGLLRDSAGNLDNSLNAAELNRALRSTLISSGATAYEPLYRKAAHHLLPTKVAEQFEVFLRNIGYKHNHASNGVWMTTDDVAAFIDEAVRHAGNHRGYSQAVADHLDQIKSIYDQYMRAATSQSRRDEVTKWAQRAIEEMQSVSRKELTANHRHIVAKGNNTTQNRLLADWQGVFAAVNVGAP